MDPLPDADACHGALMADDDALDYLVNIRGLSKETIIQQKLGMKAKHYFRNVGGEVRALVIPYLINGTCVWAKYRTLPDPNDLKKVPKDFSCPTGYDAALYNGEVLKDGLKEVIFFEGELDCIAALDKGIPNAVAVPGANIKKAEWLTQIDALGLDKVYICYDLDKVGQKAAQELACRIGIDKCYKLILPQFEVTTEKGEVRAGKDINEWFVSGGGTLEAFEALKQSAQLFDVNGVANTCDAIDEFTEELDGKGAGQKYIWPPIQDIAQFDEGDCIQILGPGKQGKSTLGLNLLEYMVNEYNESGVIICLEMTRAKLARKWVCHKAGIADNLPKAPEDAAELTQQFKDAIPVVKELAANREGDLLFCYPAYQTEDDLYKLIIDIIRRYGVKWIMLDNLQLLCDNTIKNRNRTQHLSEISKRLTKIGKDYGVQMVIILQPHSIGEGKLATSDSVDGSSQVSKDCDLQLVINRIRIGEVTKDAFAQGAFIQTEGTFGPEMLVSASLSRYSAGGTTTLYFDGATSTVHKLTDGKIAAMNAKANPNVGYAKQLTAANLSLDALKVATAPATPATPATLVTPDEGDIII